MNNALKKLKASALDFIYSQTKRENELGAEIKKLEGSLKAEDVSKREELIKTPV
ncbi:MAG: hypothetical protein LBL16_03670 [Endomicrobium sp.]|jgi:hypothetical protein|nr:hypothetical protein [Endomicrobium sp.]